MVEDLIYDVGMHDGSDTQYYLAKGYRVVAIEANPILVADATKKFQREISAGRLTILPIGVGPQRGEMTFWVNDGHSEWSSFVREVGCRDGTACHPIQVPCLRFREVLEQYGVPYYLKLDIERNDRYCLEDLTSFLRRRRSAGFLSRA